MRVDGNRIRKEKVADKNIRIRVDGALVKRAKNYTMISGYMNIKKENEVCAMNDGMRTILQLTKCSGIPRQMLFAKGLSCRVCFKKGFKNIHSRKATFRHRFTSKIP